MKDREFSSPGQEISAPGREFAPPGHSVSALPEEYFPRGDETSRHSELGDGDPLEEQAPKKKRGISEVARNVRKAALAVTAAAITVTAAAALPDMDTGDAGPSVNIPTATLTAGQRDFLDRVADAMEEGDLDTLDNLSTDPMNQEIAEDVFLPYLQRLKDLGIYEEDVEHDYYYNSGGTISLSYFYNGKSISVAFDAGQILSCRLAFSTPEPGLGGIGLPESVNYDLPGAKDKIMRHYSSNLHWWYSSTSTDMETRTMFTEWEKGVDSLWRYTPGSLFEYEVTRRNYYFHGDELVLEESAMQGDMRYYYLEDNSSENEYIYIPHLIDGSVIYSRTENGETTSGAVYVENGYVTGMDDSMRLEYDNGRYSLLLTTSGGERYYMNYFLNPWWYQTERTDPPYLIFQCDVGAVSDDIIDGIPHVPNIKE